MNQQDFHRIGRLAREAKQEDHQSLMSAVGFLARSLEGREQEAARLMREGDTYRLVARQEVGALALVLYATLKAYSFGDVEVELKDI